MQHVETRVFADARPATMRDRLVARGVIPVHDGSVEAYKTSAIQNAPKHWRFGIGHVAYATVWLYSCFCRLKQDITIPLSAAKFVRYEGLDAGKLITKSSVSVTSLLKERWQQRHVDELLETTRSIVPEGVLFCDALEQDAHFLPDPIVGILDPETGEEVVLAIYDNFGLHHYADLKENRTTIE